MTPELAEITRGLGPETLRLMANYLARYDEDYIRQWKGSSHTEIATRQVLEAGLKDELIEYYEHPAFFEELPRLAKNHQVVNYRESGLTPEQIYDDPLSVACANCAFYIGGLVSTGGRCTLVEGRIRADFTSDLFEARSIPTSEHNHASP